jgi:hypothetical protein
VPLTLEDCGLLLGVTRERSRQIEVAAKGHLFKRKSLIPALKKGLATIQNQLLTRIAGVPDSFVSDLHTATDFCQRLGPWETLLIELCHGRVIPWLNAVLQPVERGWLFPDLDQHDLALATEQLTAFLLHRPSPLPIPFVSAKIPLSPKLIHLGNCKGLHSLGGIFNHVQHVPTARYPPSSPGA